MRMWKVLCGAALLTVSLMPSAHADEWNKLTYFTFNAPVDMPGMTLPAGTYRFELADPETGRRVIRVSEKDGSKVHGIFLSISNDKLEPSDNALLMFKEAPAGAPQPVKAWWYPGESYGYEFVYPNDQAMRIAKANHTSVLSTDGLAKADTASSDIARVGEDEALKDSSRATASTAPSTTATTASPATTTAGVTTTASPATAAATTTAEPAQPAPTTAPRTATPAPTTAEPTTAAPTGTSGTANTAPRATGTSGRLPKTASPLPLLELLSGLSLGGGLLLRSRRT